MHSKTPLIVINKYLCRILYINNNECITFKIKKQPMQLSRTRANLLQTQVWICSNIDLFNCKRI